MTPRRLGRPASSGGGTARIRVTAPRAFAGDGRAARAWLSFDGQVVSEVYEPIAPRLTPTSLLAYIRAFIAAFCISVRPVNG